jgi:MFS family permease
MSVGLIFSRISAGKKVDHGQMTKFIIQGYVIVILGLVGEIFLKNACLWNGYIGYALLFVIAFCLGYGYGTLIPALNMLFINLAPHQRRATANSTYLTSWDIGIGTGIFLGGYLSEWKSFTFMYAIGVIFSLIALILFVKIVIPHFFTYKLR